MGASGLRYDAPTRSARLRLEGERREALARRIEAASELAQRHGRPVLASVTLPIAPEIDPSAAVLRARRADDRFFCLELPEREGFALATLGQAARVEAHGGRRFGEIAAASRAIAEGAQTDDVADDPARPLAAGPVWVGGFAFADDGGAAYEWSSLAPGQLVMPELSLARQAGQARLTATIAVRGEEAVSALLERLDQRLDMLEPLATMPLADPDPIDTPRVIGAAPPEHYESAVARAVERIASGALRKIVLAREVRVHSPRRLDPAPVLDGLRTAFPGCYSYCVGTPELALVGASPELLIRRDAARAQTVAVAGTTRRSADSAVDAHLGAELLRSAKNRDEQQIVSERITRSLRPVSVWVAAADAPSVIKVQNVQHLATAIRAQLAEPISCVELAGRLHPTPAVGGEPWDQAAPLIPALEGIDRGWYAGPVGWTNLSEDGEFCVALRCALLRERIAHLYAGDGIVRESVPAEELAETELKLQALLQFLS